MDFIDRIRCRFFGPSTGNLDAYSYLAHSPLVGQIQFKQGSTVRVTTTRSYDYINRLTSISSSPGSSFSYAYNAANQRTQRTDADNSYWQYQYDPLGQVKSGKKYWEDDTPIAGQQFEYAHDDIGNRTETRSGGDTNGASLRVAGYSANSLNQYTGRLVPGYIDILGVSILTNVVTVNGLTTERQGEYFRKELSVNNSSAAIWTNITVAATGQSSVAGDVFLAQTNEVFTYDKDGNLTNDGRWQYTWDAENRLIQVESLASAPTDSKRKVTWTFDAKGRRVRQTDYVWNSSTLNYEPSTDLKFVSDGWRHVAELNGTNNALVRSYAWGLDLSGSLDGAGGVGGLLMLNSAANGVHFYGYDGNGNVAALVKASDGTISANYDYEPFGKTLRATGPMAKENRFQFSTKRCDAIADFLLYEYRVLRTDAGRWLNRDPLMEKGGENIHAFVNNDPSNTQDSLGLRAVYHKSCGCTERATLTRTYRVGCFIVRSDPFRTCLGRELGVEKAVTILNCLDGLCGYRQRFRVKCVERCPVRPNKVILAFAFGDTVNICRNSFWNVSPGVRAETVIHEFLHLDACGALLHPPGGQQPGAEPEFDAAEKCFRHAARYYGDEILTWLHDL